MRNPSFFSPGPESPAQHNYFLLLYLDWTAGLEKIEKNRFLVVKERGPKAAASSPKPVKAERQPLPSLCWGLRNCRRGARLPASPSTRAGRSRRVAPSPPVQCPQPACSALPRGPHLLPHGENPRSAAACWEAPKLQTPSILSSFTPMVIWSCSSCLRGFISGSVWRRHRPLLSPRSPAPLPTHFLSSSTRRSTKRSAAKAPVNSDTAREPFYVIRKGGVIGIYKTLSDCQAQVGNSVCDPSVTVYKGYSLRKETEEYLAARGLRNAIYSIDAADARDELFSDLVPCPFQQPDGSTQSTLKRSEEMETGTLKHQKVAELEPSPDSDLSCILEFDGACKGNPGKSGAGVIIRRLDGSVIALLREGLGVATNNAAEYRALILGLDYAAKKGFKHIHAQGDSKLVCKQIQDLWRVRSDNMAVLCKKAKELKGTFLTFEINHVLREFNSDADVQANFAVQLAVDEVQELSVC